MTGKAKGTGPGLAVVKQIIEGHGGTIAFPAQLAGNRAFSPFYNGTLKFKTISAT
jgi:nitrogen-specific signal transduction histidine kinase